MRRPRLYQLHYRLRVAALLLVALLVRAIFPTAPVAQPRVAATAITAGTLPTSQARPGLASAATAPAADETAPVTTPLMIWLGVALLVVLIGAGVGIIVLQRRWR